MQAYIVAFVIGGLICVIGQLLMDMTPLTSAHVLVLFVVLGGVLSSMGLYQPLVDFAGAGATVPLLGFGHALVSGAFQDIDKLGFIGILSGPLRTTAIGITAAIIFGFIMSVAFNPKG